MPHPWLKRYMFRKDHISPQIVAVCVQLFATPWTAACQASLSFTIFQSLLKLIVLIEIPSGFFQFGKLIWKFIWHGINPQKSWDFWKRKTNALQMTCLAKIYFLKYFKMCFKTTTIKTVWHWQEKRKAYAWDHVKCLEESVIN